MVHAFIPCNLISVPWYQYNTLVKGHAWNICKTKNESLNLHLSERSNILDHCYTAIKDASHSVPRAALRQSDYCLVQLIPIYRQKLKSAKPV